MAGFNTSTRKDDLSVRLRAHNMKHARDQTKRLAEENQKMEERLHELKNAMNREKEDRERKGGGFWRRGQTDAGSLTSYASEVLQSKSDKLQNKEIKKKKIKVLQDEPLDIPKRSSQPGTIKNIAQRKLPTGVTPRGDKLKGGPKCGQCEDRTATLTCVQCSEIFCFGCFSAFHLKGALKQHRSVPLSATGSRICMSPRTGHEPQSSHSDSQASGSIPTYSISSHNESGAASPPSADSSLLSGNYNESQSAASFQQALMAWRQGEQTKPYKPQSFNPRKSIPSPRKTPVLTLDESIGTTEQPRVLEIKFKSTLTYADRLMLKKHRRTELAEMPTPRIDGSQSHIESDHIADSSLSHVFGTFSASREPSFHSRRQDSNLENGHIDFQSLFEAVKSTESPVPNTLQTDAHVLSNTGETNQKPALRQTVYTVKEVSAIESWKLENNINSEPLGKADVAKHNNKKSPLTQQAHITEMFPPDTDRSPSTVDGQVILSGRNMFRSSKRETAPSSATPDLLKDKKYENLNPMSQNEARGEESLAKASPRPKMGNSRAGKKSRPGSRAESSASSRLSLKGNLTKCPSEALKKVSQKTSLPAQHSYNYNSPLEDFFLAGVEPEQQGQQTPRRSSRDEQRTKSRTEKISNRLYQMAPRSWRPDSSLGETIPLNEVKVDANSEAMILAYSYSGQITGRATEWRPSSSQSRASIISPDPAIDTSLVFGDEMFTAEASKVAKKMARAPSAPRSGTRGLGSNQSNADTFNYKKSISSAKPSDSSQLLKSSSKESLHSSKDSGGKTRVPSKSSTPLKSKNDPNRHSTQSKALLTEKQNSSSKSREALKAHLTKSVDSSALSRQNSQASEHSNLNKKTEKMAETNSANQHKESSGNSQKTIQILSSDIIQGRSALMRKSSGNSVKNAKNVSNRSESDQRPLSSTNVPQVSTKKGQLRPNSSTGSSEPLRKTQLSIKTKQLEAVGNTVIADMMMSRVQEDGWVANQPRDDSSTDSDATISVDYDDGNDMISLALTKPMNNSHGGQHWETEVRPFSGVSITSKGAKTQHTDRGNKKVSHPVSSRPVSTLSGRESRAIIIDGDDLSSYDDAGITEQQDMEDKQALDQLEWELASDTGRLTADGQISRMSLYEDSDLSSRSSNSSVKPSGEQDYDIQGKLFEDERNAEQEVDILLTRRSLTMDESEVRALR